MAQLVPFHCSARVPALDPPAAVHDDSEVQATPSRPPPPWAGLGVGWMVQLVPFHRSARVPWSVWPTAVHAEDDVHDTSSRNANCAPAGLGAGTMAHAMPFHRSARFTWVPELVTENPTAVHENADGHATAIGNACCEPAGLGIGCSCQLEPSHRSASAS